MKEYRRNKIRTIVQLILIFTVILFLDKATFSEVSVSVVENDNLNKTLDKSVIAQAQDELYKTGLYNPIFSFTGELTGYSGDCPLCSGYLACPPRTNVLEKGIYYDDKTYGTVRIVASSRNYPCGTILKFKVNKLSSEPMIAIVLDRGVGGNVIDLLVESASVATKNVGRVRNLEFEVLRNGWK